MAPLDMADTGEPPPRHSPLVIIRPYLDPPAVKEDVISKHPALLILKPYLDAGPTVTSVAIRAESALDSTGCDVRDASDTPIADKERGALVIIKPYLDTASGSATTKADPSLLGIPAELRNEIYRLVLIDVNGVDVDRANHDEPALLQTCTQIRVEAQKIFLEENTFDIEVKDFKPKFPNPSSDHWFKHVSKVCCWHHGDYVWTNLKAWLKDYHHGFGMRCAFEHVAFKAEAAQAAFVIVRGLNGSGWSTVETVLEAFRAGSDAMSSGTCSWKYDI